MANEKFDPIEWKVKFGLIANILSKIIYKIEEKESNYHTFTSLEKEFLNNMKLDYTDALLEVKDEKLLINWRMREKAIKELEAEFEKRKKE